MNHESTLKKTLLIVSMLAFGTNPSWSGPPNPTLSDASRNTAGGSATLSQNIGMDNTGFGYSALTLNKSGIHNSAFGSNSLLNNTTGSYNAASGSSALRKNTIGVSNTASGTYALYNNVSGNSNSAFGVNSLLLSTTSSGNTAIGTSTLYRNSSGSGNTALGYSTLFNVSNGSGNLALGFNSGLSLVTGSNNIYLSNSGATTESSTIRIGSSPGQTRAFIAGIRGIRTGSTNAVAVVIDSNGQLGTLNSSERYKKDITDMNEASRRLLELRPVTYHYKQASEDGANPLEYGLIAEEVAKVYPDLVVSGADGKIETVQYHKLTPMLVNEVKHLHQLLQTEKDKNKAQADNNKVQEQEIAALKQRMIELQTQSKNLEKLTERLSRIEANQTLGMVIKQ